MYCDSCQRVTSHRVSEIVVGAFPRRTTPKAACANRPVIGSTQECRAEISSETKLAVAVVRAREEFASLKRQLAACSQEQSV